MTAKPLSQQDFDDWVEQLYRARIAAAQRDGEKRLDAVAAMAKQINDEVNDGKVKLPLDIESMVLAVVHRQDERASRHSANTLEIVVACLNGDTILGVDDPILDAVIPVGGGLRKTWRYVNIEDVGSMAGVKTQHSADAAIAANDFQGLARPTVRAMVKIGPDATIGDAVRAAS